MKPKILIIGNNEIDFQISDEKLKFINSFDIIVRINRMNNFVATGQRVDWWWLDHNITKHQFDKSFVSGVKRLIVNWSSARVFGLLNNNQVSDLSKMQKLFPNLPDDCEIVKNPNYHNCNICERSKYWVVDPKLKTVPTTFIICISHIVDEFADTHDIYFTCTDIEGREELYKTNPIWSNYWHANVGIYEEDYLKMLIATDKVQYIDLKNE